MMMIVMKRFSVCLPVILGLIISSCAKDHTDAGVRDKHSAQALEARPRLVVQITVDQLRGDMPGRFRSRFPEGGFRYLFDKGTHFTNAHYNYANTETAVGHSTLFTGAIPARHGIIANDWIDPVSGAFVYNTEDNQHHLIGKKAKPHSGVSPRNLLVSTIGDELVKSNNGASRVFSVSGKDRGAILPGGHKGKAFWYSKSTGEFVTSTYYYDTYPEWVADWNAAKPAERFRGQQWTLLQPLETYVAKDEDDRFFEADFQDLGRTFPHNYGDSKYLTLVVGLTPSIDELTIEFALELLSQEKLGSAETTDFLAISLSATDYTGHLFGPASLESEDNLLRVDRRLAQLFSYIDQHIGLENTLIVLSADHGGPFAPEQAQKQGLDAGRFPFDYFKQPNELTAAMQERYGRDDFIDSHSHPYLYLNYQAIKDANLDAAEVEKFLAEEAKKIPGIYQALSRSELQSGEFADTPINQQILRNFHPARSGAIHLVQEKYWFLHSTDEAAKMGLPNLAAIHGSPWEYDTHVPIFFAGHTVPAQSISRPVSVTDIAPTLAAYLGVESPSGAEGKVLGEVIRGQ